MSIEAATENGVLTLTLTRSTLDGGVCDALARQLRSSSRNSSIRCVVITGSGDLFCDGIDPEAANVEFFREHFNPVVSLIRSLGAPVIAAINGAAMGAGVGLALACDLRVANSTATLRPSQVHLGLPPDPATLYFLPRMCGLSYALSILLEDRELDPASSQGLGLIGEVHVAAAFEGSTRELAERLARAPTSALDLMKRGFDHGAEVGLEESLEHEALLQHAAGLTRDYREGVAAFLEKRPAVFRGE
jgi:2-(1,2-epoxy-1,2-dihydrophenyl)acetyl-CoA isomerase